MNGMLWTQGRGGTLCTLIAVGPDSSVARARAGSAAAWLAELR
jgi:hypothetical protein